MRVLQRDCDTTAIWSEGTLTKAVLNHTENMLGAKAFTPF